MNDMAYDAAGNLLTGGYVYDAENRLLSSPGVNYDYDPQGRRVQKSSGTLYWYDLGGNVLEETNLNGGPKAEYVFFGGKRIARLFAIPPSPPLPPPNSGGSSVATFDGTRGSGGTVTGVSPVLYYFSDHLGSTDVVTDASGNIVEESEYYPFGGERGITDSGIGNNYKFTGKERDPETGCDYFGARYYCNPIGRFITPDWSEKVTTVPYADLTNPQSLNLYSYVTNNPLNRTDPSGHDWFYIDKKWQWQKGHVFRDANGNVLSKKGYEYLLVFNKTGTNKYGAAMGTLTLYNQNKVAAHSEAFSGGPNSPAKSDPIPNGNYMIQAGNKTTLNDSQINPKTWGMNPWYGMQKINALTGPNDFKYDMTWEWGDMRAMLNHPENGNPAFQGNYLHGKLRPEDYTHGCICERSETILHQLWNLNVSVPVEVK